MCRARAAQRRVWLQTEQRDSARNWSVNDDVLLAPGYMSIEPPPSGPPVSSRTLLARLHQLRTPTQVLGAGTTGWRCRAAAEVQAVESQLGRSAPTGVRSVTKKQVLCPFCHRVLLRNRVRAHLDTCAVANGRDEPSVGPPRVVRRRPAGIKRPETTLPSHEAVPGRALRVYSKRGTRVLGSRRCSRCAKQALETFRYSRSSHGVIYLCSACRARLHPGYFSVLLARPLQGGDFRPR